MLLLLFLSTMTYHSQGDYVWIEPTTKREFDVAIGARVVSAEGKRIQVVDDDAKVSSARIIL